MNISLLSNVGSSFLFKSPISRFAAATAIIGIAVFTISKINEHLKSASAQNHSSEKTENQLKIKQSVVEREKVCHDEANDQNSISKTDNVSNIKRNDSAAASHASEEETPIEKLENEVRSLNAALENLRGTNDRNKKNYK